MATPCWGLPIPDEGAAAPAPHQDKAKVLTAQPLAYSFSAPGPSEEQTVKWTLSLSPSFNLLKGMTLTTPQQFLLAQSAHLCNPDLKFSLGSGCGGYAGSHTAGNGWSLNTHLSDLKLIP